MKGQDSHVFNAGGQSKLVRDSSCRGKQHTTECSCCFSHQHTFTHPDVVTDGGQKTFTEVVSASGVTSGWTCRPSRAATQDSCKSSWWQCVSSLEVQEGLQAVVKPSFFSISAAFTFSKVYANENQRSTTCCRKVRLRTEINILEREAFARPQKCGWGV